MFKFRFLFVVIIFSSLLIGTSIIKNQTREIEKQIYDLSTVIANKERDLNETQLDFSYLTSPAIVEEKIEYLDITQYMPMDYSRIFLSLSNLEELHNKVVIQENLYDKKTKKK
tara:strand:- start:7 stop:345 length:339 start_codon:yes stop_codon:yes gene_type:complete